MPPCDCFSEKRKNKNQRQGCSETLGWNLYAGPCCAAASKPQWDKRIKRIPDRLSVCSVELFTILLGTERTAKEKGNKAVTKRDGLCLLSQLSTEENLLSVM